MNNTCGKCGGFTGDFTYSGEGAVICNCKSQTKHIEEIGSEKYLEGVCFEANPHVLDDDMPDFFDSWLSMADGEDYIRWAEEYATTLQSKQEYEIKEAYAQGWNEGQQDLAIKIHEEAIKELEGRIEKYASLEHERWAKWQKYFFDSCMVEDEDANPVILSLPKEKYDRWERQIATPYSELSEKEKESDREQVRPYLNDFRTYHKGEISKLKK